MLQKRLNITDAARIDYMESDVRTCTFLTRDTEGNYAFRHKSFVEFFVGEVLASQVRKEECQGLSIKPLPPEIKAFAVEMLRDTPPLACLENWHEVAGRSARNRAELERVTRGLTELGLTVVPSQTNFVLARCPGDAAALTGELLRRGVIVRPMNGWGLDEHALRISVGLPAENTRCLEALEEILA